MIQSFLKEMVFGPTGYIYFIQMDRIGPIKIGFTKNILKRIYTLQVSSPYPLRLLVIIEGTEEYEKKIHYSYRDIRLNGEWFLPHPIVMKDIEELKESNKNYGFISPIPEFDLDNETDYFGHIDYDKGWFHWDEFLKSLDYQRFKREKDVNKRNIILDKYTSFYGDPKNAGKTKEEVARSFQL